MSEPLVLSISPTFGSMGSEPCELLERGGAALNVWAPPADGVAGSWMEALPLASALIVGTQAIGPDELRNAEQLVVIAKHGVGVDNIDLDAAADAGIVVTNTPGVNSVAVAELTMGFVIALARGIPQGDRAVRVGEWRPRVGRALEGATLGIVGLGAIGRLVAVRAVGFGMRLIGYDALPATGNEAEPWERVGLETLLGTADFVTLHVPLTPETECLIDADAIAAMKRGSYLINTARGGIVDEAALVDALDRGHIAGAAFDVFAQEPPRAEGFPVETTILTPHMGAYSDASVAATSMSVAVSIDQALRGVPPHNAVNAPHEWRGGHPGYGG